MIRSADAPQWAQPFVKSALDSGHLPKNSGDHAGSSRLAESFAESYADEANATLASTLRWAHDCRDNHYPGVSVSITTDAHGGEHGTIVEKDDWKTETTTYDAASDGKFSVLKSDDIHDAAHHESVQMTVSDGTSVTTLNVEKGDRADLTHFDTQGGKPVPIGSGLASGYTEDWYLAADPTAPKA